MKNGILKIAAFIISVALLFTSAFFTLSGSVFVLKLEEDECLYYEYGTDISRNPITAEVKNLSLSEKGVKLPVFVEGKWNKNKIGKYPVIFKTEYEGQALSRKGNLVVRDTLPPEIKLVGSKEAIVSPVATYTDEGFTAFDLHDGDLTEKVKRTETKDKITYTVTDSFGNTAKTVRKIIYRDINAPVIALNGGESYNFQIGSEFSDPGFTATDEVDGDITAKVKVKGKVDGNKKGEYTLKYSVTDSNKNKTEVTRTVYVSDFVKPSINLAGAREMYVKLGSAYSEPGFSASDNIDGNLTPMVIVSGSVDTNKTGYYTVSYTVTDSFGNKSVATRSVLVYRKQAASAAENPGDKVVYLTFDDGPGQHTARLLDILDRYGVKATFFVTNQFPSYQYMIGETYRRGHTVALHTYSHKYSQIYASKEAYLNDLSLISDVVYQQTGGFRANIIRFPGGTNNLVARPGVMTGLAKDIGYHGYLYFDWNVSSGDAGGATTVDAIYNNVVNGVSRRNVSVVLQHDIKANSVTAVEKILFWGINNGYTFLPITEKTPLVQFKPQR